MASNKQLTDINGAPLNSKRSGEAAVRELYEFIAYRLEEINSVLPDDYKVSFLARHTNMPEGQNADIFISEEGPTEVRDAMQKLIDTEAKPAF